MKIQDFTQLLDVHTPAELKAALGRRSAHDANEFWIAREAGGFPALSVLVRGHLAYLHFFPEEAHPGFASVGSVMELPRGATSTFYMGGPEQEHRVRNESILPLDAALVAATEFLESGEQPTSIEWLEL